MAHVGQLETSYNHWVYTKPWAVGGVRCVAELVFMSVFHFASSLAGSDLASPCQRLKQEYAERARVHNQQAIKNGQGVVLLLDGACAAHIIHREIESQFSTQTLIPKLHATAFAISLPGVFASVAKCVQSMVRADLSNGFFPGSRC
jgi:hypothetical protein